MNKETLAKAKQLEEDIRQMKNALSYYKQGTWSHWDWQNDRPSTFHFAFMKNYSGEIYDREDLPRWLNKRLMAVVEEELHRTERELEMLGDDTAIPQGEYQQPDNYQPDDTVTDGEGNMYVCKKDDDPKKRKSLLMRFLENMVGIGIYAWVFFILITIATPTLSTSEHIGYSLILGFFAGAINNIERVLRELFDKKEG